MTGRWFQWTGEPDPGLVPFLRQAPGLIHWLVQDLFGHGAVLKISYELSQEHPTTVPPGWWLHFDGHHISAFERGPEPQGPGRLPGVGGG